ncbi:MAG: NAD(P)/FAD-dependent oxidoreductase [Variovorax sp.]|nr:NAD(P)/FAD-dependent oxidoreductase [Variovorax sp.]
MTNEVVILGGGPAGLSCALWLHNSGYSPRVLEQAPACGGLLRFNHHENDWLLGFPNATGLSIRERFIEHVGRHDFPVVTSAALSGLRATGSGFGVAYSAGGEAREALADFLVIASGTRPRAPAELESLASQYPQRCLIGAGQLRIDEVPPGRRVAMLGGGDNAFENAWLLARRGVWVDIYYRGEARAQRDWQNRCAAMPGRIGLHPHTATDGFAKAAQGLEFRANGELRQADIVVVMYGYGPNTDALLQLAPWLGDVVDAHGFVQVNEYQRTALPRLYAIGDVTNRPLPTLPSAIGQGSVAAKAIVLESEGRPPAP